MLRDAHGGAGSVESVLRSLKKKGFINYYGLQRFGDDFTRNEAVGHCLLLGKYADAADALLRPTEGATVASVGGEARDGVRRGHRLAAAGAGVDCRRNAASGAEEEARAAWLHSNDARTALKLMPRAKVIERAVLTRFASSDARLSHETRCRLAVLSLPLAMRRLLAHAYFSRAFNVVASERVRRYGLAHAKEGELVFRKAKLLKGVGGPRERRAGVHMVTAAEEEARTYTAWRVVLPLPGTDILMPRTPYGSLYAQMLRFDSVDPYAPALERSAISRERGVGCDDEYVEYGAACSSSSTAAAAEGGDEDDAGDGGGYGGLLDAVERESGDESCDGAPDDTGHNTGCEWEENTDDDSSGNWFYLTGDYRAVIMRPRKMHWRVLPCRSASSLCPGGFPRTRPEDDLAQSERRATTAWLDADDELMNPRQQETASVATQGTAAVDVDAASDVDVAMQFDLPPGAYATMALREVSKAHPPPGCAAHLRFSD